MLGIYTNILVRLLTGDDADQLAQAQAMIGTTAVRVSVTVLLETAWVLGHAYGVPRQVVVERLQAVAGLPNVNLQDPGAVCQALAWAAGGMDIGDAFHLAQAGACEAFITFDHAPAMAAASLQALPVVRVP